MLPPFTYHRTISISDTVYVSYLIKFTPDFIAPFFDFIGKNIFDELYEQKVCHFTPETQQKIEKMFQEMLYEFQKDTEYKEVILQGMLFRLFTTIWENRLQGGAVSFPSPLSEPIIHAIYHIEKNYAQKITLESIAKELGFSTAYFSRLFKSQLGMSFSEYLNNSRINHAQTLLARTDKSIMDIAMETGFCQGDYFATQFKHKTGMTPSEVRNNTKTASLI